MEYGLGCLNKCVQPKLKRFRLNPSFSGIWSRIGTYSFVEANKRGLNPSFSGIWSRIKTQKYEDIPVEWS